ncbi:hypothetical protein ACTJI8_14505 [Microbacterium sp. 22303]|uniref:hypothetical protein n=1 Tax=Microbacterium sp. 22303 TaxID=3453905 RepID=UPI003F84AB9C
MAPKRHHPHIHDDSDVSSKRLTAFALEDRDVQTAVLAELRAMSADESNALSLTFASLVVAVLLVVAGPLMTVKVMPGLPSSWLIQPLVVVVAAVVLIIALSPMIVFFVKEQKRRERAFVWLGAYQDELARRHRLRGSKARRWQRAH